MKDRYEAWFIIRIGNICFFIFLGFLKTGVAGLGTLHYASYIHCFFFLDLFTVFFHHFTVAQELFIFANFTLKFKLNKAPTW